MSNDITRASLELLYHISRELATIIDLRTVLNRVIFLSLETVKGERGSIIVLDDKNRPVDSAIVYRGTVQSNSTQQLQETIDHGLAGWVARHRQAVLVSDTSLDTRWLRRPDDALDQSGAKSAICVPLLAYDRLVGMLTVVHPIPGTFNEDNLALMQAIADQAGIAVLNARLFAESQAAQRQYYDLFNDSIDPIVITDNQGRILEANRQLLDTSGYDLPAISQLRIDQLHPVNYEKVGAAYELVGVNETLSYESSLQSLDQTTHPVQVHVRRIRAGEKEFLQWILRDISERKDLDTMREDLIAMIYHDLRSPLANVLSSLDLMSSMLSSEEGTPLAVVLKIAIRSTQRIQRLVSSLLDIYRLEAGQSIAHRESVEPLHLIAEAVEEVQPNLANKQQTIHTTYKGEIPPFWGDADMIRRVLVNLLDNASKYSPEDSRIEIGGEPDDGKVRIWVRDEGPGIPEAVQEDIFNKFARLRAKSTPKGLGLGLAFCRLAVQAHGGEIGVESKGEKGSCFYFTLPAAYEENPPNS